MDVGIVYKGDGTHIVHSTDCGDLMKDLRLYKRHNAGGVPDMASVSSLFELADYLYGHVEGEGLEPESDEYREAVLAAIESDSIPDCVKWPLPKLESAEEEEPEIVLGQWEVTIKVGSSLLYVEIEAAHAPTTDAIPVPMLRVATYSVKSYKIDQHEKRKAGISVNGVPCYFVTHWRYPMTDWEEKINAGNKWHCDTYNPGGLFHRTDRKGSLKHGTKEYNDYMSLIRDALNMFESISPEWRDVSYSRDLKETIESSNRKIEKAEKDKEEALDMRQWAVQELDKLKGKEGVSDWLEED